MAHELARRADGSAATAFVGNTPWHGLGQKLTKGASIGVWKKEAGLDWEALEGVPSVMDHSRVDFKTPEDIEFPDYKALYRSDSKAPLAIVGAGYRVVQPGEVLEFFRNMTETQGWWIHTAGALRGGRKVWALATNDQAANVGKGDRVEHNILLATSLDGSMQTTIMETSVRVVCANTLALALKQAGDRAIKVSHRSIFDHDAARQELGIRQDNFRTFIEQAKAMADTPVKLDEARDLLNRLFKVEVTSTKLAWLGDLTTLGKGEPPKGNRTVEAVLDLFKGAGMGSTLKTAQGTRWGLLNAITEHVDWNMGRADDTRVDSAWFGRGSSIKGEALELLSTD